MNRSFPLLALVLLSACVAETIERHRPRKGPIKEVGFVDLGGGKVRYSVDGWSWFVAGRRRHALRLMRKNCGKKLSSQVLDEYLRQDADISYAGDDITASLNLGMDHFKIAPFQHMTYECRPKGAAHEAPRISTAAPRVILVVPPVVEVSTITVIGAPAVSTATVSQEPPK